MGSKEPRATTLNFPPAVRGGTLPAFSTVRKFGRAKKRRSLEVPAAWFSTFGLSLSLSLSGVCVWSGAGDGFAGSCVVWAEARFGSDAIAVSGVWAAQKEVVIARIRIT